MNRRMWRQNTPRPKLKKAPIWKTINDEIEFVDTGLPNDIRVEPRYSVGETFEDYYNNWWEIREVIRQADLGTQYMLSEVDVSEPRTISVQESGLAAGFRHVDNTPRPSAYASVGDEIYNSRNELLYTISGRTVISGETIYILRNANGESRPEFTENQLRNRINSSDWELHRGPEARPNPEAPRFAETETPELTYAFNIGDEIYFGPSLNNEEIVDRYQYRDGSGNAYLMSNNMTYSEEYIRGNMRSGQWRLL